MTCIVGMGNGKCMAIGADSCATDEDDGSLHIINDSKVFTIKQINGPDAFIGFTDSFRMGQLLMSLKLPEDKSKHNDREEKRRFLRTRVVPIVRKLFAKGGFLEVINGKETGGSFLLGYRNWIYEFAADFSVNDFSKEYLALGSGALFSRGALDYAFKYTEYKILDLSQDLMVEVIKRALDVAGSNMGNVCGPMKIITLPLEKATKSKSTRRKG